MNAAADRWKMNWQERASAAGAFSWLPFPRPQRGGCCWQGSARGCLDGAGAQAADGLLSCPGSPASAGGLARALSSFHTGKHKEQHWELWGSAGQVCDSRETWGHHEPVVIFGWCILRSAGPQGAFEVVCTSFPYLCGTRDLQVLY